MKRINLKPLVILIAVAIGVIGGTVLLRRFQVSRNAGSLAKLAKIRLDEGKPAEALMLFGRYLGLRPDDHAAFAEYARLMLAQAEAPDATRNDVAKAYNTLETAVRRNPDDDELRRRLAEFQLRIGRAIDAREHLEVLRERLASGEAGPASEVGGDEPAAGSRPLTLETVDLLAARSYLAAGDVPEAGRRVAAMVGFDLDGRRFDPDTKRTGPTEAYIILAAILQEKLEDPAAATLVLDRMLETYAGDPQAWLAISSWHRQRGEYEAAEREVAKAIELAPDDPNAVFARFELALARRDLAAAESLASNAVKTFPGDERGYRGLAAIELQKANPAAAELVLLEGIERFPGKASLLLMLADALLQQGKFEDVGQTIARIKELYGVSSPAVGLLEGRLLVGQRKWAEAKTKLEAVRPVVIGSPELVRQVDLYLGQCHAQLDEYDAQLDVNRRILTDDPTSLAARAGTAAALAAAGKISEALAEFESLAAALPPDQLAAVPQVWYPLLQLRMQTQASLPAADRDWDKVDALLDILQQSAEVTPTQLLLLRADSLVRKGERDTARELLQTTADREPDPQVWSALATLVLRTDGPDAATDLLAKAPPTVADTPPVLVVRAQAAARRPEAAAGETLADIEAMAASLPPDQAAETLSTIAGVALAAGQTETATRIWTSVAALQPDEIRPHEALLELAVARGDLEAAKAAAAGVARASGAGSARARAAEAGVLIFEVRKSAAQRQASGEDVSALSAEERRRLDEARNLLIEAENDRPGWNQLQVLSAEIEGLKGNVSGAIERLKKAVALGPASPALTRRLVSLLYASNRLEEARLAMETLGVEGEQGLERLNAEAELRAGKFDDAVALAERSVERDSSNPDDLLWLGQLLARSGKNDRAADVLTRATDVAPERSDAWVALFSQQVAMGRNPLAARSLARAAELMPEPKRQLTLAQGYEMLGRPDEAEEAFREAVRVAPGNLESSRGLAAFLVRCGRLGPARETLDAMIASTDDSAAARGERAWARRMMAEMIAERGTFRDMQRAMQLLQENVDDTRQMSVEDTLLLIKLLTSRPEPASWKQAIATLEELSRKQPLSIGQRIMLAQLHEKVGAWDDCRNELVAVVAGPNVPPAYIAMLVEKMLDHGEVSSARPWLARLQKASPDSAITIALEAKFAIAQQDRKLAAEAARKLMPGGIVAGDQPAQLNAVARLMEQLGFPKAADKVLAQLAERSADGVVARADFLGRQGRIDEALDLLDAHWNAIPLERLLTSAMQIVRCHETPATVAPRVEAWIAKGRRIDPGSIVLRLLEAELRSLEGNPDAAEAIYRDLLASAELDGTQKAIVSNNLAFHLAKPATVGEARTLIDRAIDELGPLPDLLDTRGMVLLAAGDARDAVTDLQEAVLQATDVKFLHLAWAQLQAGDESAARRSLDAGRRKGLAISRLSPADRKILGDLEAALGVAEPKPLPPQG